MVFDLLYFTFKYNLFPLHLDAVANQFHFQTPFETAGNFWRTFFSKKA